ncbi:hypothetical protein D3C86_1563460 [compost metagenome]
MHEHRAGAHGAAFTGDKREPQGFIQRGIGLPRAPVAVPVINVLLRQAQVRQGRVHHVMGRLEAMPSPFKMSLPEAVHDIHVIERANHVLEDSGAFLVDFARRQLRQILEEALVGPLFVIGKHAGSAYIDHRTSPMANSASPKDSAIHAKCRGR